MVLKNNIAQESGVTVKQEVRTETQIVKVEKLVKVEKPVSTSLSFLIQAGSRKQLAKKDNLFKLQARHAPGRVLRNVVL